MSAFYASAHINNEPQLDSSFFYKQLHSFAKGNNYRRYRFIKKYTKRNNLNNLSVKTQGIDWLGLYRNVIVEKKGETDSIVYVVCHYDKIDGNLIVFPNLLINGSLDILLSNIYLSKGAYDNGTGVVSSMALMQWINNNQTKYTYRFLFAGMEEYGLRRSRGHVSSLSKAEWNKCVYAINIDMIASRKLPLVTVSETVSDSHLTSIAWKLGYANNIPVITAPLPKGALSDFYSFKDKVSQEMSESRLWRTSLGCSYLNEAILRDTSTLFPLSISQTIHILELQMLLAFSHQFLSVPFIACSIDTTELVITHWPCTLNFSGSILKSSMGMRLLKPGSL